MTCVPCPKKKEKKWCTSSWIETHSCPGVEEAKRKLRIKWNSWKPACCPTGELDKMLGCQQHLHWLWVQKENGGFLLDFFLLLLLSFMIKFCRERNSSLLKRWCFFLLQSPNPTKTHLSQTMPVENVVSDNSKERIETIKMTHYEPGQSMACKCSTHSHLPIILSL